MATVSVEDLANEIMRHHSSPEIPHLLNNLRRRNLDLREFCSRVRQLLGADVLIRTANGLKQSRARLKQSRARMARWRMVSRVIGTLMLAWRRAAERAYAPGGAGFDACHQEFAALAGRDP